MSRQTRTRLVAGAGLLLALMACEGSDPPPARVDSASDAPRRIVSLVPSVTRMIVELGAGHRLVGRTDYDTAPPLDTLPSVGGGLNPSLERLVSLRPDLVVRFQSDTDVETPARLDEIGIAHLAVRADTIADVRSVVRRLGRLLDETARADSLIGVLDRELERVREATVGRTPVRAAFVLGGTPPWVAGPHTFVDELITLAGGVNAFADLERPYAGVSPEVFRARDIDVILLGPGTDLPDALVGDTRVARLTAEIELPGLDLYRAAWAVAAALHEDLRR